MTPLENYDEQLKNKLIRSDDSQLAIMKKLDVVYQQLLIEKQKRSGLLSFLHKAKPVAGLYLCGSVGIGKTMMMDCFYHSLSFNEKMRMHFHPFMRMIHRELKALQGKKNPVAEIAKQLASRYMVICFDEFIVTDIADAMLLARLLEALFANGVTIVATSNVMPDDLYKRGLQRDQFLPAIELIKKHTEVCHILATQDYRLRHLNHAGVFFIPNDEEAVLEMQKSFDMLAGNNEIKSGAIQICGREIKTICHSDEVVWFEFEILCSPPRSQMDYLELADKYKTVFISNVRKLSAADTNQVSLLIKLVDVFYDHHIRLVLSAEDSMDNLYPEGRMVFEYQRTCSRLFEMQSEHYFYKS